MMKTEVTEFLNFNFTEEAKIEKKIHKMKMIQEYGNKIERRIEEAEETKKYDVYLEEEYVVDGHASRIVNACGEYQNNIDYLRCYNAMEAPLFTVSTILCKNNNKLKIRNFSFESIKIKKGALIAKGTEIRNDRIPKLESFDMNMIELSEKMSKQESIYEEEKLWKDLDNLAAHRKSETKTAEERIISEWMDKEEQNDTKCQTEVKIFNIEKEKGHLLPSELASIEFDEAMKKIDPNVAKVVQRYKELFIPSNPGQRFRFMRTQPVKIPLRSDRPQHLHASKRPISKQKLQALEDFIELGLSQGLLERSNSQYSSAVNIVNKMSEDGKIIKSRVTGDYRQVNSKVIGNIGQNDIPDVTEALYRMGDKLYMSKVDIKGAFHRQIVENDGQSRELSAIQVNHGKFKGVYHLVSLAMGISVSPALFCKKMTSLFEDVADQDINYIYYDDIIIASYGYEQHIRDINTTLSILYEANVALDIHKTEFCKEKIEFLGMSIGGGKLEAAESKTRALDEIKCPNLIDLPKKIEKNFQQLIGFLNYFRKFVKNFAKVEEKIRKIMKTAMNEKLEERKAEELTKEATEQIEYAVNEIKECVLMINKEGADITIMTDASCVASGYVCIDDETGKPLCFGSKIFKKNERKHSIFELELRAVSRAVDDLQFFIRRAGKIKIKTDNAAVLANLEKQDERNWSSRTMKLILDIQSKIYQQNIYFSHISGIKNKVSDYLSRMNYDEPVRDQTIEYKERFETIEMIEADGIRLTRNDKKMIEKMQSLHNIGHFGREKLLLQCKEANLELTPKLRALIPEILDNCKICQREKRVLCNKILGKTETPRSEMTILSTDFMELHESEAGNRYILTFLDNFSKYSFAFPTKTKTMTEAAEHIRNLKNIFPTIRRLSADNAFACHTFENICEELKIEKYYNCSNNSRQCNVERSHRSIRSQMKMIAGDKDYECGSWETYLSKALVNINTVPNMTTKVSPYKAVFKCGPPREGMEDEKILEDKQIVKMRKEIYEQIEKEKKKYAKKDVEEIPKLKIGQICTVRYGPKGHKEFKVKVLEDLGFSCKCERIIQVPRYNRIKIHKRHLFIRRGKEESSKKEEDEICAINMITV